MRFLLLFFCVIVFNLQANNRVEQYYQSVFERLNAVTAVHYIIPPQLYYDQAFKNSGQKIFVDTTSIFTSKFFRDTNFVAFLMAHEMAHYVLKDRTQLLVNGEFQINELSADFLGFVFTTLAGFDTFPKKNLADYYKMEKIAIDGNLEYPPLTVRLQKYREYSTDFKYYSYLYQAAVIFYNEGKYRIAENLFNYLCTFNIGVMKDLSIPQYEIAAALGEAIKLADGKVKCFYPFSFQSSRYATFRSADDEVELDRPIKEKIRSKINSALGKINTYKVFFGDYQSNYYRFYCHSILAFCEQGEYKKDALKAMTDCINNTTREDNFHYVLFQAILDYTNGNKEKAIKALQANNLLVYQKNLELWNGVYIAKEIPKRIESCDVRTYKFTELSVEGQNYSFCIDQNFLILNTGNGGGYKCKLY